MKFLLPCLTLALAVGCVLLGYRVIQQNSAIVLVNFKGDAARKDAQKRITQLQQQLAAAKTAQDLANKQIAQLSSDADGEPKPASTNASARVVHISDILKEHPEYAALYAKLMRRTVDRMYGSSLSSLNLPPDQVSQLKDILTQRMLNTMDAQQATDAAGLERGSPGWRQAITQASQTGEQQLVSILGNNADSQLIQLQARGALQTQVTMTYTPDFEDAGVPLSTEQSNGLIQAMVDANYSGKNLASRPSDYNQVDPATGLTPRESRVLDNAAQVLTPAQLQVLKSDQLADEQQTAIFKQYSQGGRISIVP